MRRRRHFRRLDHCAIAGSQHAGQWRERQVDREIPGADDADDAFGLVVYFGLGAEKAENAGRGARRRSVFIQRVRCCRACLSGPIEEATSANAVTWLERAPKSAFRAVSISLRWSTGKAMRRLSRSIRMAAEGAPWRN
jgi:hypothetical protein